MSNENYVQRRVERDGWTVDADCARLELASGLSVVLTGAGFNEAVDFLGSNLHIDPAIFFRKAIKNISRLPMSEDVTE